MWPQRDEDFVTGDPYFQTLERDMRKRRAEWHNEASRRNHHTSLRLMFVLGVLSACVLVLLLIAVGG